MFNFCIDCTYLSVNKVNVMGENSTLNRISLCVTRSFIDLLVYNTTCFSAVICGNKADNQLCSYCLLDNTLACHLSGPGSNLGLSMWQGSGRPCRLGGFLCVLLFFVFIFF